MQLESDQIRLAINYCTVVRRFRLLRTVVWIESALLVGAAYVVARCLG